MAIMNSSLASTNRWSNRIAAAIFAFALAVAASPFPAGASDAVITVIVEEVDGTGSAVQDAVTELGGTVGMPLGIIDAFTAEIPASALGELRSHPQVEAVTLDSSLQFLGKPDSKGPPKDGGDGSDPAAPTGSGNTTFGDTSYSSELDGSMHHVVAEATGALSYWADGDIGQGVTVALVDSGVVPVDGLIQPGKVINGLDISFESQADNLRYLDSFGHGTHMAGIIAGNNTGASPTSYPEDATTFYGVAPGASILNVKVANFDGSVDVSQVIAAIDWVVQHRNDNGMNVRVLNMSFGTDGTQEYLLDPLAHAVEQAVQNGIVVVVAAGNDGNVKPLRNPALDPHVIAVGALNTNGTKDTADDTLPNFTNCGNADRHVDLVAPGVSIVSLRAPGSYADLEAPSARVDTSYFKGTGTSQAAAVVSGIAAVILSARPNLTPLQVKNLLMKTASPVAGVHEWCQGAGLVDAKAAHKEKKAPSGAVKDAWASGTGTLEEARGSYHLEDQGVTLEGEQDIFGNTFDSVVHASDAEAAQTWDGGIWNGASWSGASWSGASWSGASWSSASWSGASWSGASWSSASWSSNTWNGASWSGASWSGASWSGASWSAKIWSGLSWR